MGGDIRVPGQGVLTEEWIKAIDEVSDSPSVRAQAVWQSLLPNLTDWDIVCFCVETLGLMSERYSYLREPTKWLAGLVYKAHYLYPENFNARVGTDSKPAYSQAKPNDNPEPESNSARIDAPRRLIPRDDSLG